MLFAPAIVKTPIGFPGKPDYVSFVSNIVQTPIGIQGHLAMYLVPKAFWPAQQRQLGGLLEDNMFQTGSGGEDLATWLTVNLGSIVVSAIHLASQNGPHWSTLRASTNARAQNERKKRNHAKRNQTRSKHCKHIVT